MRFSQQEKYEIIKLVDGSDLSVNRTLKESGIRKQTFCSWYKRYLEGGSDGLASKGKAANQGRNHQGKTKKLYR
jgi:putative transposase